MHDEGDHGDAQHTEAILQPDDAGKTQEVAVMQQIQVLKGEITRPDPAALGLMAFVEQVVDHQPQQSQVAGHGDEDADPAELVSQDAAEQWRHRGHEGHHDAEVGHGLAQEGAFVAIPQGDPGDDRGAAGTHALKEATQQDQPGLLVTEQGQQYAQYRQRQATQQYGARNNFV